MVSLNMPQEQRTLSRETDAVVIPAGYPVKLPAGTVVEIAQVLGGNYTCLVRDHGMVRISWQNADALGDEVKAPAAGSEAEASGDVPPDEEKLWNSLKSVFDPEIPVNIVDLGLVYSLKVERDEALPPPHHRVLAAITLTAPGCGMGPTIAEDARLKLCSVPGVAEAQVSLVWDPPWNQSMISEEGKMRLGLI
jgi:probable FeS assembly SUF system protein SufT